ncbi:MAG: AAA family ATPase [Clostridia bacterium]
MANYCEIKKHIKNNILAKTSLVVVESFERMRVERLLKEVAVEMGVEIDYYCDSKQFFGLLNSKRVFDAQGQPLEFLATVITKGEPLVVALSELKYLDTDNAISRNLLNLVYLAKENECTIVVATSDPIWTKLAQVGVYLKLELPSDGERQSYIKNFVEVNKGEKIVLNEKDIIGAATLLSGFSEMQMSIMLSTALVSKGGVTLETISILAKRKSSLYGSVAGVSQVEVSGQVEVAGLENLMQWLEKKKFVFFASEATLIDRALCPPKGVLLGGVPGCGKSLSAKMIAAKWKLPLYRFDIDSVYDKYVGESERNMRIALEYIDNISPCVLWVDEIEKMLSATDNSNDISRRILGQFLYWLQESKSRVFLVATANNVNLLPAELFRKGRLSEIFFIDLPNDCERQSAIELYAKLSLHKQFEQKQMKRLVELSKGFSCADIEMAIKEVAEDVIAKSGEDNFENVENKFKKVVSISKASPDMIAKIEKWGKECAINASKEAIE